MGGAWDILLWGIGGAGGTTDILFSLLASVGLIVRAPNPEAWLGMTDILLLLDPGVVVRPGVPLRRLEGFGTWEDVGRLRSGLLEGVNRSLELWLLPPINDLARIALGDLFSPAFSAFLLVRRKDKPLLLSVLDFRPPTLGRLLTFSVFVSGGTKVPGPMDFLGAFGAPVELAFGLLNALGGNWL